LLKTFCPARNLNIKLGTRRGKNLYYLGKDVQAVFGIQRIQAVENS
jgi:hypothetical protein